MLLISLPTLPAKQNAAVGRDPGHLGDAPGLLPEQMSVYLDRGYDSQTTRQKLKSRGLEPMISEKGKPAPFQATERSVVERINTWHYVHKKLVCTELTKGHRLVGLLLRGDNYRRQ
jgi:hypothetical protein